MAKTVSEKLAALRRLMTQEKIDAYLIPTDDFHMSEYVGDYFKCRQYISGFTGSAGTVLVLMDRAFLWTDGRYFLQAGKQLSGSGISLMKAGEPGVPAILDFLKAELKEGQTLGYDGRTMSAVKSENYQKELSLKGVSIKNDLDLVGKIWDERPRLAFHPVMELDVRWCGQPRAEKLEKVREKMKEEGASAFFLSSLDDIAWLLNIRGSDVHCTPVVLSYFLMTESTAILYADIPSFPKELCEALMQDHIELRPYEEIYSPEHALPEDAVVMLSKKTTNSRLVQDFASFAKVLDRTNPTLDLKAVKNDTETANMRIANIRDGAAVTKFIFWLKQHAGEEGVTEMRAAEKLLSLRSEMEHFQGNSFDPIISYREHGAIIHYSPTAETDVPIRREGMLLADTGGQYLEGTTDTTRTIVVGPVTDEEKLWFTRVLKGHLRLAMAHFLYGCTGLNLDYLAREPLWRHGEDYNHGTGHGIGYFLNVHEGPNGVRWKIIPERADCTVFEEGMITSNEPGYYVEGKFGIRHENLMLCKKAEKTHVGQFMCFEILTMVPFDLEAVDASLLDEEERHFLNDYHRLVFENISGLLTEEERLWLKECTRCI